MPNQSGYKHRTSWILNRGYTGHEHLDAFGIINMNGRVYDPLTAQFFSPDSYVQSPGDWLNYNRYTYCSGNPFRYTDPSGNLQLGPFYLSLNIGWSPNGGLSLGVSAGIGIQSWASVGISINYGFKNNNLSFTANAGFYGGYAYAGYDTKAGFISGAGYSFISLADPLSPISFNTNITSVGVDYSQNGGFSGNYLGMNISSAGMSFNPSVGVSINPQDLFGVKNANETTSLTEAQKNEIRKKEIYAKETAEQDNNYNFFYRSNKMELLMRLGAEYIDDGGVGGNTIVINAHGNKNEINAPTERGKMTPEELHNYLLSNNKLYQESYIHSKPIVVRIVACNTGNGFAREFSSYNHHMLVYAPTAQVQFVAGFNYVVQPGKYVEFWRGK